MIYNFNLGIGWASSGVEYAQAYRAFMLRNINANAKFIFTDMFLRDNIQHMTENIGFLDSEVIWLYTFFTDQKISPVTYTLEQFEKTLGDEEYDLSKDKNIYLYRLKKSDIFYRAYLVKDDSNLVHRVEVVSRGCLIRKDYYTYCRSFSEYYGPLDNKAHLYHRNFYNEDGSVCYQEIIDNESQSMYKFPDKIIYSKHELVEYMVQSLNLTTNDTVIIDRTTGIGQAILQNVGLAKVGIVIHADHFSEGATTEEHILWNNYYEYAFHNVKSLDFMICATDDQNKLVREQFKKYTGFEPNVVTIPVGSLPELKRPHNIRKRHSLITASRLATEKHVDWLIKAVVLAREQVPDITLDIYGKGAEEKHLNALIREANADEYIRMMGQHKLDDIYMNYDAYFSASTSEGFGLTLMEAVGSGLPIIGFDVRYGNQNFIDNGKNGYKIAIHDAMSNNEKINLLSDYLIKMFIEDNMDEFHEHSYVVAEKYLTEEVEKRWLNLITQ